MSALGFALFPTAIGDCALAWGAAGLVGVQLPEGGAEAARGRMRRRFPLAREAEPPAWAADAARAITALLAGEARDLAEIRLDLSGVPTFHARVYEIVRTIPPGRTLTYGEVARRLGDPHLARAVGQAMGRNPFAPVVPCHRVTAAGGRLGGFSAAGGVAVKQRMLAIEGAGPPPGLFD